MSEEQQNPEPDGFDEIVASNLNKEEGPTRVEFDGIWDVIRQVFPLLYEGVLIRGLVVLDIMTPDGRELTWVSENDVTPWEVKAMAQQVVDDIVAETAFYVYHGLADDHARAAEEEGDDDE